MAFIKRHIAALAAWLLAWATADPTADPVLDAVHRAYLRVGLPDDKFAADFDLMRSGKLAAVLKFAADDLGMDSEFSTVADVVRYLKED